MALWIFCTCSPVDLSTCPAWLTGPDVNIGVQDIMGNSVFANISPYQPVPLCFFLFFVFLFSLTSLPRLFQLYRDEPIGR